MTDPGEQSSGPAAPAGWYKQADGKQRFWDGKTWTDRKPNNGPLWAIGAIVVLIALCCGSSIFNNSNNDQGGPDEGSAFVACKDFVRDRLKSPSSAEFGSINDATISDNGAEWTVSGPVDAENSFGASLRMNYVCVIEADGDSWVLKSLDGLG
jgi:hypothetical protein